MPGIHHRCWSCWCVFLLHIDFNHDIFDVTVILGTNQNLNQFISSTSTWKMLTLEVQSNIQSSREGTLILLKTKGNIYTWLITFKHVLPFSVTKIFQMIWFSTFHTFRTVFFRHTVFDGWSEESSGCSPETKPHCLHRWDRTNTSGPH